MHSSTAAWQISVLCSQPSYRQRGKLAATQEERNGVDIFRISAPGGDKNRLLGRLWNFGSLTLRMGWAMLKRVRKGDVVVVLTNPPSLPLLAMMVCRLKGAQPVLWVQDVYPDVLAPVGLLSERCTFYRLLDGLQSQVVRRMAKIIVLGRDMQERMVKKLNGRKIPLFIIPNWGELTGIEQQDRAANPLRQKLGLKGKFIVQMSGNLGRTHGLEDLVGLAKRLQADARYHFLIFGWGAVRLWLEETIEREQLKNISLLEPCAKEELATYLSCCDLFFLPFKRGMEGISVPSRMYNVMAAGNAILAVAGSRSELAQVVEEERIGWVVEPGNIDAMVAAVKAAIAQPEKLEQMRQRARVAAASKYNRQKVIAQFAAMLEESRDGR